MKPRKKASKKRVGEGEEGGAKQKKKNKHRGVRVNLTAKRRPPRAAQPRRRPDADVKIWEGMGEG